MYALNPRFKSCKFQFSISNFSIIFIKVKPFTKLLFCSLLTFWRQFPKNVNFTIKSGLECKATTSYCTCWWELPLGCVIFHKTTCFSSTSIITQLLRSHHTISPLFEEGWGGILAILGLKLYSQTLNIRWKLHYIQTDDKIYTKSKPIVLSKN